MSWNDKLKNRFKEFTEEVKGLLKGSYVVTTGLVSSAATAIKLGPLQDIADMLRGFADMYQLEGAVKKEYGELQQRLQTLLQVVETHSEGGISPAMESKIKDIRDFVEGELNSVPKNPSGRRHGRLLMAKDEEDRFIASCRRIQEYMERLSLDASLSMWKLEEQQSKEKMFLLISRLPSAPSAWYNSSAGAELKRRECTPGTRLNVLANLLGWANNSDISGVYWLNGMAGTGKTTIAYSICKELAATGTLAASFFCSRLREECRNVNVIIPSISYQLAQFSPIFRHALSAILDDDQDAHHKILEVQFEALIKKPLLGALTNMSPTPQQLVVVIDALDECENKDSTRIILDLLLSKTADLPIKFLVSSRPEPHIRDQLNDERVKSRLVLHELDKGEVKGDVERYLREGLAPMSPSDEQVSALVEKAGILFIYAATAVRYIGYDNFQSDPEGRLGDILDGPQCPEDRGNDGEMDQLYMTILEAALGNQGLREAQRDDMRQIIYTVVCAREPLTTKSLSELLGLRDTKRVRVALRPLWSVLHVVGVNELVTTLHASFPDFIFDPARSKGYYCDSGAHHRKLAEHSLNYIAQTQPQFNICGLESSYLPDKQVPDFQRRVKESISSELLYACRYWAEHVKAVQCASDMVEQMRDFLSARLLLWMEVLNMMDQMKAGMECAKLIVEWRKTPEGEQDSELAELARDAKRFVEAFASNPVSQSTPHIYVSMLALWPKSAAITKYYGKYARGPVTAEGTALERRQLAHRSTWAFEKRVDAITVSSNGLHIGLAIGQDVLVVDSSSGKLVLGPLQGHLRKVKSVGFSPDMSRILAVSAGSPDKYATLLGWDTRSGNIVLEPLQLHGHTSSIYCISLSSDCSRVATGSFDNTVCLWDSETGQMLHRLEARHQVSAVVFSSDGTHVAAAAGNTLQRWDSRTGQSTNTPSFYLPVEQIGAIAFSPDQSSIITGIRHSNVIYVWNALSRKIIRSIREHTGYISSIGYSPDGKYIVSGSGDRSVRVWDAENGNMVLGPLEGHTNDIYSVIFSPDGSQIISACQGGLVCTWDARQRNLTPSPTRTSAPYDPITCVKFSSDGTQFVSGSTEGTISIWDAHTGEMVLGPVKVHTNRINAVDFKNHHVVSGSRDGNICVCDARNGEVVLGPLKVATGVVETTAYSPDGKLIATGAYVGVYLWNARDGSRILGPLSGFDNRYAIWSVQFSPDSTRIAATSNGSNSNIVVWDVPDGRTMFSNLDGHLSLVRSVSYSPNGALIASGSQDCTIILWDVYTGKKAIGPLTGHSYWVLTVSFSPDSTRLVSGSLDRTIRIWDVQTGETLFKLLHGHEREIKSVEYSPDGTRIMSHSDDKSVQIHDARSPEERAQSRRGSTVGDWIMKEDGWVVDDQSRLLVWVPGDLRKALMRSETRVMISRQGYVRLKFDKSGMGELWASYYTSDM